MKRLFCIIFAAVMLFAAASPAFAAERTLPLASRGATDYRIVISARATAAERTAADTLAEYLYRISGAVFPVVTDDEAETQKELVVGVTARESAAPIDRSGFDDDSVLIRTVGDKIFFTGGEKRGALYAVYTFLEDRLGCRWFTHDLTVVPETDELTVSATDFYYEPCFKLRQTFWAFSTAYPDYCAAHKLHGVMAYMSDAYGGGRYELAVSGVHTLGQFVTDDLFDAHPEYFGCDENGQRKKDRQPCLSSEGVFDLAVAWAKNYFAGSNAVLSLSQNDNRDFCRCDKCRSFAAAHGGVDSACMLDFVDRVAEEVKKEYPDARLETLAYQATQTPPTGLTVADNVVIRLCGISTCTLHDLDDPSCPANKRFCSDLTGWSELTDSIYIWDYSTDFQYYYALYPNITALQARYRFYRDRNVVAVFDHGCGDQIVPGEFHELRTYLICKLLWDPDADVDSLIREFCAAYYGAAGDDVVRFIYDFESCVGGFNPRTVKVCHNSCYDGGVSLLNNTYLTASDVIRLDKLMSAARDRELSADEAHRLEGLSLSWRFFKCATKTGEFERWSPLTDPDAATNALIDDMRAYGIGMLSENGRLRLEDADADARQVPTFWYTDETELPRDMYWDARISAFFNRLLRALFAPLRALGVIA